MRGPPGERSDAELLSFGVVNLDKQPGPSAHEVAGWVRDAIDDALGSEVLPGSRPGDPDPITGIDGAAHGGTLDPKVTGCLPILLGDATRLAQVLHRGAKEYVAVLELHADPPTDLESVIEEFEGPIYQKPPRKSAVKRQLRVREIYDLDVLELRDRQALLRIRCEGGTYVRKLCHDLGLALGTGAHMGHLRRTGTTPFDDRDLVTMEALVDALAEGRITGAGLDVFEREPRIHPRLPTLQNVVMAPHLGSATVATRDAMARLVADAVIGVLAGREPANLALLPGAPRDASDGTDGPDGASSAG